MDVFVRGNYTADSNAMMVGFLREFAEVVSCGINRISHSGGVSRYRNMHGLLGFHSCM